MKSSRRAVATLELVMALPILLVMLVALIWFGYSLIGQAEVSVQARHGAWQQRFEPWSQTAFDFTVSDAANQTATAQVEVTPLLSSQTGPEAGQSVEKGNWDHRSVEFGSLPNWKLYGQMVLAAKTAGLQGMLDDASEQFHALESLGVAALSEAMAQFTKDLLNPGNQFQADSSTASQRADLEGDLEMAKLRSAVSDLAADIDALQQQLDALKESDDDEDRQWLLEQQQKRLRLQLKLARNLLESTQ